MCMRGPNPSRTGARLPQGLAEQHLAREHIQSSTRLRCSDSPAIMTTADCRQRLSCNLQHSWHLRGARWHSMHCCGAEFVCIDVLHALVSNSPDVGCACLCSESVQQARPWQLAWYSAMSQATTRMALLESALRTCWLLWRPTPLSALGVNHTLALSG